MDSGEMTAWFLMEAAFPFTSVLRMEPPFLHPEPNAFPRNQRKVFSELSTLIDPVVKQWYQEQHPKTVEDHRINGFAFYVYPKDPGAEIRVEI